jgi:putative hydrolase of the HAD superfamily
VTTPTFPDRAHLLVDADDTLWENNVVFERIIDDFAAWVRHPDGPREVRRILEDVERALVVEHGYGTKVFVRGLHETLRRVAAREPTTEDIGTIERLVEPLAWRELELIDGVEATLDHLGARHDLLLVTKGDRDEQQLKIDMSGLAGRFRATVIVAHKTPDTYRALVAEHALDPSRTWMIGNSPASDIVPALAAGLGAVHVPHPATWALEHDTLPDDPRLLQVAAFKDLVTHF